jgi:hypothetical protein
MDSVIGMRKTKKGYARNPKCVYIKSTTVSVPSSELGLSQPLSGHRVCPSPQNRVGEHTRLRVRHRVGRVLSFFSSRRNWDSPTPLAAGECAPPPFGPGGREHSPAAKGVGESQFQRVTYSVVLYVYKYFVG